MRWRRSARPAAVRTGRATGPSLAGYPAHGRRRRIAIFEIHERVLEFPLRARQIGCDHFRRDDGVMERRDHDRDAVVLHDCDAVEQMLLKLLSNAAKFSKAGTPIRVTVTDGGDGFTQISVADQGIGIPERDLERIFERFYRVDAARSRATGGTGLGLAIVKHVVAAHGGKVTVCHWSAPWFAVYTRAAMSPERTRPFGSEKQGTGLFVSRSGHVGIFVLPG